VGFSYIPSDLTVALFLTVIETTISTQFPRTQFLTSPDTSVVSVVAPTVAVVLAVLVLLLIIVITCGCCYIRKKKAKHYTVETPPLDLPPRRRRRSPIYEELPCGPIYGTEPQLMRQVGIEHDPTLSRHEVGSYHGSDEPLCGSSDVSGLSGVSGNIPGAHKMPSFTADDSTVSDRFLHPPLPWTNKNVSSSTFNTTATHSTVVSFHAIDNCHDYNSEVHYPHATASLQNRRCNSQGVVNSEPGDHQRSASFSFGVQPSQCLTCQQHLPFSNAPIAPPSKVSSNSSIHRKCSLSASSSLNNSPYHQSPKMSPYHQSCSPYHHQGSTSDSLHLHRDFPQPIGPDVVNYVINHVQHNRNCQIPGCCCRSLTSLSMIDIEHNKAHGGSTMRNKPASVVTSSSTESESDTPDHKTKKHSMHLELKKDPEEALYPHNHLTTKSYAIRSKNRRNLSSKKRRSRSLADLTPITETRETPTPVVGGPVVAGTPVYPPKSLGENGQVEEQYIPTKRDLLQPTAKALITKPRPQLLKQRSISIDNVPALCLNDCVAKLTTPSPTKHSIYLTNKVGLSSGGSGLKAVPETGNSESDGSNTSSRSRSPTEHEVGKLSQSDTEDVLCNGRKSFIGRKESLGYESGDTSSLRRLGSYNRFESSGYESAGGCSTLESRTRKLGVSTSNKHKMELQDSYEVTEDSLNLNPTESLSGNYNQQLGKTGKSPQTSRSSSPFETETQKTNNGGVIFTTEC